MQVAKNQADYRILAYFAVIIVFGLIMLTSASSAVAHQNFGDNYFFIKRQILFGLLPGLALFFVFAKINLKYLRKIGFAIYGLSILLLLLVFIPGIGANYGTNAQSWLNIFGYSFQPAEFAKLGLILFIAHMVAARGRNFPDFISGFFPTLCLGLVPIGLTAIQPDIGTVAILFFILFGLLYIGRSKILYLVGLALFAIAVLGVMIWIAPYRAARLTIFLHPELDPQGIGYHINQAYLAIGSGGLFGRGLGNSLQKYQYLPEVSADSIFAVIAEEMGFVLAVGFVILHVLIIGRGLKIVKHAPDDFSRLVVSGIILWLGFQSFLNMGAMVGIMPLTGVPLPFVSHGGTALMVAMAAVGIVVNVSRRV